MMQTSTTLEVQTRGRGFADITGEIRAWVSGQAIRSGLLNVFIAHTSASLIIQENADPDVLRDLEDFFSQLVPEGRSLYRHRMEGADDMPAHIRSVLTQVSINVPVADKKPVLGTWQGVYVCEHRGAPHLRKVHLHLIGE